MKFSLVQRTVLKVDISCDKGRKKLLQAVSGIQGVDRIEIDINKGTLTVTGNGDPYDIILKTQKVGKFIEVVSVGPPPPPPGQQKSPNEPKKPEDNTKKPEEKKSDQKPQAQAQSKENLSAQSQTQVQQAQVQLSQHHQVQPQAPLQLMAQFPTQAHTNMHNPHSCLVCQHMYMYQWPAGQHMHM